MSSRKDRLRQIARGPAGDGERRSKLETAALGREGDPGAAAFVALKYFRAEHQCFSQWDRDELRAFSDFNRKVSSQTWMQILGSGGRAKTGLGYTLHEGNRLPRTDFLGQLSEDISWAEMRVTQKARVHGFRAGQAFFLVFLDRNHEIFPS